MLAFILCAALMTLAALGFVLLPLLRPSRDGDQRAQRLHVLEAAREAGVVDADEYALKRSAIEAMPASATAPKRAAMPVAAILIAFLVPATALVLYRLVGTPRAIDASAASAAAQAEHSGAMNMQQAMAALEARLKEHPDDVQGWALLGRAHAATGEMEKAADALRHAHELAPADHAITVEYAQAMALAAPDHRISGQARSLLDGVIAKEPANQRALWLLGISEFQDKHYDAAIARWNALLPLLPADSDIAAAVKRQIAEAQAQRDGKLPPAPESPVAPTATSAGTSGDRAVADAPARLTVRVALDPKLEGTLDPQATLFVFARAASGPPMPLAIERHKAGELPLTVTLDDRTAMMPDMKLSDFPQVVVGARISRSGNASPQSGDLQAISAPLDVQRKQPVELLIDQRVP